MDNDKIFLEKALNQAKKSVNQGGFPAGAIVVKEGIVIAKGVSLGAILNDPTEHAETSAIRKACKSFGTSLQNATLYASLQPCLMCFSVANWAGIKRIVYGCRKTEDMISKSYYEGRTDLSKINKDNNNKIKLEFIPDFEQEMLDLIKSWEKNI